MRAITNALASDRAVRERPWVDPRKQVGYLMTEWRLMFRAGTIVPDALAGVAVALVALPLSLAIAVASGVPPAVGLITAIIGGITVGLFGGCRLQVSGPAAAMTFLVYEIVSKYGMAGLVAATLMAAGLQILAGVFRLGRFMQFIPRPVVAGFLSGIGLTILCTQLPAILGYEVSHDEEGGALALLWETLRRLGQTDPKSLAVGASATAAMIVLPRMSRKLPTPLVAVVLATVMPIAFGWSQVALLGELPKHFPIPSLPRIPWGLWNELVMAALAIFVLASLESLLSASVIESMDKRHMADHDQELIGQGTGNLVSALFGGIPVTGVIARSATNVQAGARTRLATILHALALLAMMFLLGPLVAQIPRAALAGVLIAVALRMIEIRMLKTLWRGSRAEAAVFLATTGAILMTDLIVGVPVGMIAAFLYVIYELSQLNLRPIPLPSPVAEKRSPEEASCPSVLLMRVEGPLFFASGFHLRSIVNRLSGYRTLVLDLEAVPFLDLTGAEILQEAVSTLRNRGVEVLLAQPSDSVHRRLRCLPRTQFPALRTCPVFGDLHEAMSCVATEMKPQHLCQGCRAGGQCAGLEQAMNGMAPIDHRPAPISRRRAARRDRS
jgi:high affinity sulfate transporter 1